MNRKHWLSTLVVFLGAWAPLISLADVNSNPSFTPPNTDLSMAYLANIFGIVDGVLHGTGSQILGQMFGVYNSATMFLGGIIVMYTLIVGTLNTANEGEVLGKNWDTMWIPMRSALGIALLVPKASGYCIMQIFMMWVIVQGVGAADMVWNSALNYIARGGVIVQHSLPTLAPDNDKVTQAATLLQAEVCMAGTQKLLELARSSQQQNPLGGGGSDLGPVPDFINSVNSQFGGESGDLKLPDLTGTNYSMFTGTCGSLSWQALSYPKSLQQQLNLSASQFRDLADARSAGVRAMYIDMADTARKIVNDNITLVIQPGGQAFRLPFGYLAPPQAGAGDSNAGGQTVPTASHWLSPDPDKPALLTGAEIKNAAGDYYSILQPSLQAIQNTMAVQGAASFVQTASDNGWIMAGSWYFQLANVNRNTTQLINDKGTVTAKFSYSPTVFSDQLSQYFNTSQIKYLSYAASGSSSTDPLDPKGYYNITKYIADAKNFIVGTETTSSSSGSYTQTLNADIAYVQERSFGGFFLIAWGLDALWNTLVVPVANTLIFVLNSAIMPALMAIVVSPLMDSFSAMVMTLKGATDPILALAQVGDSMITYGITMILGLTVIGIGGGSIPFLQVGVFAALFELLPLVGPIITLLLTAGATLTFYLPLVPYIYFTFGAFGWFIGVIEAMVAAPIVALGVVHPEGQHKVFGRAETGIMMLVGLFLRPSLMVFGLIFGIILSTVGLWFLNEGFLRVTAGMLSRTGGFAALIAPFMCIAIYVTMATTIVSKAFTLIYEIPDNVPDWALGAGAGAGKRFGGGVAEGMAQKTEAGVSGGAGQVAGGAAGIPKKKEFKEKGEGAEIEGGGNKEEGDDKKGGGPKSTAKTDETLPQQSTPPASTGGSGGSNTPPTGGADGSNPPTT